MGEATDRRTPRSFADRLREAVEESQRTTDWRNRRRPKHRRVITPLSSPPVGPSDVRHSDELFVERVRQALD